MTLFLFGCSGKTPNNLGLHEGKLAPCPDSPNCVSSQSHDNSHFIEPLSYSNLEAFTLLKNMLRKIPNAKIIEESETYLYAEFTSQWMKFVDDVEFLLEAQKKVIHVRSASRLGYSDLGANRKRIEKLRVLFEEGQR